MTPEVTAETEAGAVATAPMAEEREEPEVAVTAPEAEVGTGTETAAAMATGIRAEDLEIQGDQAIARSLTQASLEEVENYEYADDTVSLNRRGEAGEVEPVEQQ